MKQVKRKTQFTITLIIVSLFFAGTSGQLVKAAPLSQPTGQFFIDFCKIQKADTTLWVPAQFDTSIALPSGSGSYAYGRLCPYFIADIKMATYSHSWFSPDAQEWMPRELLYGVDAYDLPSSAAVWGKIPAIEEDCNRWSLFMRVYTKMHNETVFTWRYSAESMGSWSSGACSRVYKKTAGTFPEMNPSTSGWDTYRVLAATKLRTTYQEVAVNFAEPDPE